MKSPTRADLVKKFEKAAGCALLVFVIAALVTCGGSVATGPSSDADAEGYWIGFGGSDTITMHVVDLGAGVMSGQGDVQLGTTLGASVNITGTYAPPSVTLTFVDAFPPVGKPSAFQPMTFVGTATTKGKMTGTLTGNGVSMSGWTFKTQNPFTGDVGAANLTKWRTDRIPRSVGRHLEGRDPRPRLALVR